MLYQMAYPVRRACPAELPPKNSSFVQSHSDISILSFRRQDWAFTQYQVMKWQIEDSIVIICCWFRQYCLDHILLIPLEPPLGVLIVITAPIPTARWQLIGRLPISMILMLGTSTMVGTLLDYFKCVEILKILVVKQVIRISSSYLGHDWNFNCMIYMACISYQGNNIVSTSFTARWVWCCAELPTSDSFQEYQFSWVDVHNINLKYVRKANMMDSVSLLHAAQGAEGHL